MNKKIKKVYDSPLIPKEHADIYKDDVQKYIRETEKEIKKNKQEIFSNIKNFNNFNRLAIS